MNKRIALLLAGFLSTGIGHAQTPPPPAAGQQEQAGSPKIKAGDDYITLNFSNIDIAALVKVMSEYTRRNFILDERVTGKVTLMTPTKISSEEAYQVFLSALELKGFTAIEDGSIIRIIPAVMARQSGLKVLQDGSMSGEGYVTKLIRMSYVNPQDIVKTLLPLISKDGSLIAYPATNSLIITDAVSSIKKIEKLVEALDVPAPAGKGRINVYYLKHANAEDIAKVMQALVSRLPVPPAGGAPQATGPATILEGAVTISADKLTNSLIIVASPIDYDTVREVLEKLDIRRRQVYVEAAIIEMSLAKQRELGFEFNYVPNVIQSGAGAPITPFGGTNFGNIGNAVAGGPAALAATNGLTVAAIKGTFSFKGTDYLNIGALLHALQTDSDVNVLSTPNILTSDNQKAEIMVGQNVPFTVGQTQNATTGAGSFFNTIERKDVGIKLAITPQISSDDSVRLDINQEISDVVATSATNAAGLITNKRSAVTTVVVKDRETMVIGGLIRDNVLASESKVPLLGDIPLLGWLFKYKTTRVEKTNLMIFITPYIIKNEEDAAEITNRNSSVLEEFRKQQRFEKKRMEPAMRSRPTGTAATPAPSGAAAPSPVAQPSPAPQTLTVPATEPSATVVEPAAVPPAPPVGEAGVQSAPTATPPAEGENAPGVPAEGPR